MDDDLEGAVVRHYRSSDLVERILKAAAAAGLDPAQLRQEDLAPIDEFHIGGRAATIHLVAKLPLWAGARVLDIGCGIGGATRYIAATTACRLVGVDLTPEYIAAAQTLAQRTGLSSRIEYKVASALDLPFEERTFDAAITLHVAMNIKDRPRLYREAARVLKPGGHLAIYDVMKGDREGLVYPVPWAETPATSHLTTAQEMRSLLQDAGFEITDEEDRTAYGIAFFRERLAAAAAGPPPALGLQVLVGANMREKFGNMLAGLEAGAIAAVAMIARRAG
jgi:ubiquinone/menaquinone biosynthesis C-methylase UbiE